MSNLLLSSPNYLQYIQLTYKCVVIAWLNTSKQKPNQTKQLDILIVTHTHTPQGSSCWWWVHHILLWWSWRCTAPAETHTATGRWPQSPDDRERGDLRGRALTHTQKYSPRHTHIPSSSPCPPEAALALWSLSEECRWPADGNHLENTHNQS